MKPISRVAATFAIFTALVTSTSAFALYPDQGKYEVVGANENIRMMIDSRGTWGPKGAKERGRSTVWMRWDPLTPAGTRYLASFSGEKPESQTRGLAAVYFRTQVDCKPRRYVVMGVQGRSATGQILFNDGDELPRWQAQKDPESVMRNVLKVACAAPFVALPDLDSEFFALTREGKLTKKTSRIFPAVAPGAQRRPTPAQPRCINPATGLQMLDANGACAGNDSGGSRYGQDDRSAQYLPGVPGFDPHAK